MSLVQILGLARRIHPPQSAIRPFGAAIVVTVLSLIFALMPTSSESDSNDRIVILIACVVFGLLSIGTFLRSRIAAVSALVLFSVTFAYHELPPKPVGLPSIQQNFQSVRPVPPSSDESSHRS
jgi:hypothetical protein